jgi:hypothetical protein
MRALWRATVAFQQFSPLILRPWFARIPPPDVSDWNHGLKNPGAACLTEIGSICTARMLTGAASIWAFRIVFALMSESDLHDHFVFAADKHRNADGDNRDCWVG